MKARAVYRVRQFFGALGARVPSAEIDALQAVLPPAALALFRSMPRADQRHSLNVYQALRAGGYEDRDLLAAALLHDVAKAGIVRIWHRVLLVVLKWTAPGRRILRWLAQPAAAGSWRYALFVQVNHPALGAVLAAQAGCSTRTAWLIEHHQAGVPAGAHEAQPLLAALQEVDNST